MERLFKTVQDRLVKELPLATGLDAGGGELVSGELSADLQLALCRPADAACRSPSALSRAPRPDRSLCFKTTRVLRRDWTVAHHRQFYQIRDNIRATQVQVEKRIDGTMRITHHGQPLTYQAIAARPVRMRGPHPTRSPTAFRQTEIDTSLAPPRVA